jgi:hypothetical protein
MVRPHRRDGRDLRARAVGLDDGGDKAQVADNGRADGSLRVDVRPADISASTAGIMLTAADIDQATRMLQLLVDGLLDRDHSGI